MRTTWRPHRRKLTVASVMAVAIAGLGTGAASPAAASAAASLPASAAAPGGPAQGAAGAPVEGKDTTAPGLVKPTQRTGAVPGTVIAVLSGTSVTGKALRRGSTALAPRTSSAAVNITLSRLGATSIQPLFQGLPSGTAGALDAAARQRIGGQALNLGDIVLVHVKGSAAAAASKLSGTSGISFAEPDRYVETMDTGGQVIASRAALASGTAPRLKAADVRAATPGSPLLPANYGFESSLDSYLNAQGVDAGGAYAALRQRFGQLPGAGETITNISVGDLTDASMKDAEVAWYGPTTLLQNGQRYIDLPTMPLIPAYVAEPDGSLNGTASVEGTGDPVLGEIGLDFSVMSPRPDGDQRAGDTGSGLGDLLGIAPGASYRLLVPSVPTMSEIAQAFVAAVTRQSPPDVITASLGFGTDVQGFPSRYLEEDPLMETVIAAIVAHYGVTVVDSANDGTRLYTPAAVGPDGGATPTNVARTPRQATSIDDDQYSTTPSQVIDSGSIDAGATTTDDTLSVPPRGAGNAWRNPTYSRDPHGRQRQLRQRLGTAGDALGARGQHPRLRALRPGG